MVNSDEAMVNGDEAMVKSSARLNDLYPGVGLEAILAQPIELPHGWRCVYEAYYQGARIRKALVIVYVTKRNPAQVEIEYDEVAETHEDIEHYTTSEAMIKTLDRETALQILLDTRRLPRGSIVASESVLDVEKNTASWRFDVMYYGRHHKYYVYGDGTIKKVSALMWRTKRQPFGRIHVSKRRKSMRLDFDGLDKEQLIKMRGEVIVRLMSHWVKAYLKHLGYEDYHMDERLILYQQSGNIDSKPTASVSYIGHRPFLLIPYLIKENCTYADDPGIVLHEFGHVMWFLLYARPPQGVSGNTNDHKALVEGFCDYFAATLMKQITRLGIQPENYIGALLHKSFLGNHSKTLPRFFDGIEAWLGVESRKLPMPRATDSEENVYIDGLKWAQFLWSLRRLIEAKAPVESDKADRIIFEAHFCPPRPLTKETNPFQAYVVALKEIARREAVDLSEVAWQDE